MDNRRLRWIIGTLALGATLAASAADKPAAEAMDKEKPKPAVAAATPQQAGQTQTAPGKNAAITQAVAALSQEFKENKLREKSDYFGKTPPAEVTPEAIVQALERPVPGGSRAEAYVKWQLLSAVPGKFPEDLAKRVLAVYRRAPYPQEHPGLDRRNLDRAVGGLRKEEMGKANQEFAAVVAKVNDANAPILAYRQGLFERLPNGHDAFAAGLADLRVRVSAGLKSEKFFDTVAAGIRAWAIGADRGQLNSVGSGLVELRGAVDHRDAKPYKDLHEDKGIKWRSDAAIDPKKIDALVEFMKQAASSPAGGLKFKDDKK